MDRETRKMNETRTETINPNGVPIWLAGAEPFKGGRRLQFEGP
jgi:hypothetical protein